jgi:hypothetical protein
MADQSCLTSEIARRRAPTARPSNSSMYVLKYNIVTLAKAICNENIYLVLERRVKGALQSTAVSTRLNNHRPRLFGPAFECGLKTQSVF